MSKRSRWYSALKNRPSIEGVYEGRISGPKTIFRVEWRDGNWRCDHFPGKPGFGSWVGDLWRGLAQDPTT